jgi:hypothetical protein
MVEPSELQAQEERAFPVTGVIPPAARRGEWLGDQSDLDAPNVETNSTNGLTVFKPFAGSEQPALANVKATGSMAPLGVRPTGSSSQPGKIGTQRFGSGYRIGSSAATPGKPPLVQIRPRLDSPPQAEAPAEPPVEASPDAGSE